MVGLLLGVCSLIAATGVDWLAGYVARRTGHAAGETGAPPAFWSRARAGRKSPRWAGGWRLPGALGILITVAACVWFWVAHGWSWSLLTSCGATFLFLLIAIIDGRYHVIPDAVTLPAAVIVLVITLVSPRQGVANRLLGAGVGLVLFLAPALLLPGGLGGGDVKLAGLIGLLLGFPAVFWALAVGIVLGGLVAIGLVAVAGRDPEYAIPYGPFMCLGALVALLYDPVSRIAPIVW